MEENLKWVWAAYTSGWLIHLLYAYSLGSRVRQLAQEAQHLQAQAEDEQRSQ